MICCSRRYHRAGLGENLLLPALFLERSAVLTLFAMGRQSSLINDASHEGTTGELFLTDAAARSTAPVRRQKAQVTHARLRNVCNAPLHQLHYIREHKMAQWRS